MWNAAAIAAFSAPVVVAGTFVEMLYSTPLRLSSSAVDIDWNGYTWIGAGALGEIDQIVDSGSDTNDIKFTLSSVTSEMVALALGSESARNKPLMFYMWVCDPDSHALLDVQRIWGGVMNQMPVSENGNASTLSVTGLHRSKLFQRVKPLRYTDGDQKKLSPGDRSLEYIVSQSTHDDTWPAAAYFKV